MHLKKVQQTAITAIFVALLILETFVPQVGYVRIFPALPSITTIPLTVAVYGILLGAKAGSIFGLVWGLLSLFIAYTQPGDIVSLMLFQNVFICLLPRLASGFVAGVFTSLVQAKKISAKKPALGYLVTGLATALTNTILVVGLTSLIFSGNHQLLSALGAGKNATLLLVLVSALGINGLVEAIFTAVLTPIIATPLKKIIDRQ